MVTQEKAEHSLRVGLASRSYEIRVGRSLSPEIRVFLDQLTARGRSVAIVSDEGFVSCQSDFLDETFGGLPRFVLPSGEKTKSPESLSSIWNFLSRLRLDRSSCLFVVGGGVTGDVGGFAAATYLRGIDFVQVPTTLLAMVDSSVGGKTGLNLPTGKNLAGAFHQPCAVFADVELLRTLPEKEFSAGMAEVVKYGLLGNRELFERLLSLGPLSTKSPELPSIIEVCCAEKARIVEKDERETSEGSGGRALLNLGHTFAHAIEAVSGYGDYLHGEAVAVGMMCALRLSEEMDFLEKGFESELKDFLVGQGLPVELREPLELQSLMAAMRSDKKVRGGLLRFVVLDAIGESRVVDDVPLERVERIWRSFGAA